MNKLGVFEMWCYRQMITKWVDKVINKEALTKIRKDREFG